MIAIDLQTFNKRFGGGKDQVAFNLLKGLQDIGVAKNIIVLCNCELKEAIKCLCKDATVIDLPTPKKETVKKCSNTGNNNLLRKFNTYITYKKNSELFYEFYSFIINKYDVSTILFTDKQFLLSSRLLCRTIFITHDIQYLLRSNNIQKTYLLLMRMQIRHSFKISDKVICISDYDLHECKKKFSNDMIRIYNPIIFSKKYFCNLGSDFITAINIQHCHKNPTTLIRAFALIVEKIPANIKLLFIGDNSLLRSDLLNEIEESNLKDRVVFSGYVTEEEKERYLEKTRVLVNPSLFEGFGMVAIEALAMGIPCIVADNTAQKETTMGLCRYYSPSNDEYCLANVLLEEFNNPKSDQERRDTAGEIIKEYDYKKIAQEYWAVLDQ